MPKWKDDLVKELISKGKSKDSAWAIATAVEKKRKKKKKGRK